MILSTTSDTTQKSCVASFVNSVCLYVLGFYNPTYTPPRISRYAFCGRPAVAVKVVSRSPCCSSVETISLKALASIFMSFSSELWVSCRSGASCNLRIRRKQSAWYGFSATWFPAMKIIRRTWCMAKNSGTVPGCSALKDHGRTARVDTHCWCSARSCSFTGVVESVPQPTGSYDG